MYNLNTVGRILLENKFKIPPGFAREIAHVRDKYTDGGFENIDDLYEIMAKYYTNRLESQTRFSQEKIVSFHHNFRKLETSILNDNRLVIQK